MSDDFKEERVRWDELSPERKASIKAGIQEAKEGKIVRHGPGYFTQRLAEMEEEDESNADG